MRDKLLNHIRTTQEWENAGVTRSQLRQKIGNGEIVRVDRGVYASQNFMASLNNFERPLAKLVSVSKALNYPVISHDSAALWLGAPLIKSTPKVHVTRPGKSGWHRKDISLHGSKPEVCQQAIRSHGLIVTPPKQVLFDCISTMPLVGALCVSHYFLHQQILTFDSTFEVLSRPRKTHASKAEMLAPRLNSQCESPLETLVWNIIFESGLSLPEQQAWFTNQFGDNYRVDFLWREAKVILEADGQVKYGGQFGDPTRTIQNERFRQRELERQGWTVIRVEWSEIISSPHSFIERLRRVGVR